MAVDMREWDWHLCFLSLNLNPRMTALSEKWRDDGNMWNHQPGHGRRRPDEKETLMQAIFHSHLLKATHRQQLGK